ncbi:MAG: hypothetical protein Q8R28_16950 [Dehalococcoidia bacterium]|nr:hypothetical protein [Dehalococcoidia bacterium]
MALRGKEFRQGCKHLGLASDVEQHLDAASREHRCYLSGQNELVDLSHQEGYCLTGRWQVCPWPGAQPVLKPANTLFRRANLRAGVAVSIALVFLSVVLFKASANRGVDIVLIPTVTDAATASEAPPMLHAEADAMLASATPSLQPLADGNEHALDPEGYMSMAIGASALSITALADGSSEVLLTYPEPGPQTIYVKAPSDWAMASAQLDLAGIAYAVEQVDQKNEASRYEGTWGVRAQQFRPTGNVLTSVELFLAHTSSKGGDLTVEIREDDGNGYPSANMLTSVSKLVSVGGYRWEVFDFPNVELEPGQPYWIVNYVKPLDEIAYPATPSVGDYGYYIGMSLRDEYTEGDSADFLTFPAGSRWEEYASRKAWDIMFRTHCLIQRFPTDPRLDVGSDGVIEWSYSGQFQGTHATGDLSSAMGDFLHAKRGVAGADVLVPLRVESDSPGVIRVSNIRIARKTTP